MVTTQVHWQLTGEYFENCNCDVVCPCLVSPAGPLTQAPTTGVCDVAFAIHIDQGQYGDIRLDGLNVAAIAHAPGPMGQGNWSMALYFDDRADERQREALETIFSGTAGGPLEAFAPLISTVLGTKSVPITYQHNGRQRAVEIPGIMHMSVHGLASLNPDQEIWIAAGHPFNPDRMAIAVGDEGSTFQDYGMRWDNSGKNGHYAAIHWANA